MSDTYTGLNGTQYTVTSHIKSGGEGGVYNVDNPELVAKIYDTSKINIDARISELEQKVNFMVKNRIPTKFPDGTVIVTWPQDILYKDGKFVGYVMPKISGAKPIYMLNRGGKSARSVIPGYDWKAALKVASNLAYIVSYLHSKDIVIGDMNSDNLLVYQSGVVVIIDTDSFDLRDKTMDVHYKCKVGTEEFLPPELQGCNLEGVNAHYSQYSDDFALAIHIFQLLMNNIHPFNARVITDYKQSLPENSQNHNISVGNCPFVKTIPGCETPLGSPDISNLLPDYLIEDFKNTFDYQLDLNDVMYADKLRDYRKKRTTAADWNRDLKRLANDASLIRCSVNEEHFYLASKGHCEMCAAANRIKSSVNYSGDVNINGEDNKINTDTTNTTVTDNDNAKKLKSKKRKKLISAFATVAALIVAVCFFYNPVKNYINYNAAIEAFDEKRYDDAAEKFEELGYYKESRDKWKRSMNMYIDTHYNNTDEITYRYMRKLMSLGYDLDDEYDELYEWKIETAIINSKVDDYKTSKTTLRSTDKWYVHFKISGGTPGESLNVYTAYKNGTFSNAADKYTKNDSFTATNSTWVYDGQWSFTDPSNVGTGTWTMAVFTEKDNKLLGYVSIPYKK